MKKIVNQLKSSDIDEIFDCCNSFVEEPMISVINKNKSIILNESKEYEKYVPELISKYPLTSFSDKHEIDEIIKLYTQKFSPKDSSGRKYYDIILSNAAMYCPICGMGTANTLDHFIPKSLYPQLCITPDNLIPLCSNCNEKKRSIYSNKYLDIPFHPYFENMPEKWLECEIIFECSKINEYRFYVGNKTSKLVDKYNAHLRIYRLNETFQGFCNGEIESNYRAHKRLLDNGKDELIARLKETIIDNEENDCNGWKAALYRGLNRQIDEYCNYLRFR